VETALGFLVFGVIWLVPAVISLMKGHYVEGALGLFAFPLFAWFGAARLAKPNSVWALRRYGPEKLARSRQRYGEKAGSAPEHAAAPMLQAQGGAQPGWRCLICDYTAPSRTEVERHVGAEHPPAPLESSVAHTQP
jgi:hypothetical protein